MIVRDRLEKKVREIDRFLHEKEDEVIETGVLSGMSGVALFHFYYARYCNEEDYSKGEETLAKTIELINQGFSHTTFCSGIAGVCWSLELLKQEGFIALDNDFFSSELDEHLLHAMRETIRLDYFDFLHGALGYAYYFLKRYQNTNASEKKKYVTYINECIQALYSKAKKKEYGFYWESVIDSEKQQKGCNLSLSHGISSIIGFLSRVSRFSDFEKESNFLLQQAIKYLLYHKNKCNSNITVFPNWVVNEKITNSEKPSRLAWCYGDLGIGISLLHAAETLDDRLMYDEAILILEKTTQRRDIKEAGVIDAGLCHGAYGVSHIYSYLFQKTHKSIFKEAASFWILQALDMAVHKEDGYAGYMRYKGVNKGHENWVVEANLLEGITGIGLSILSYLNPKDSAWNECLLIG